MTIEPAASCSAFKENISKKAEDIIKFLQNNSGSILSDEICEYLNFDLVIKRIHRNADLDPLLEKFKYEKNRFDDYKNTDYSTKLQLSKTRFLVSEGLTPLYFL